MQFYTYLHLRADTKQPFYVGKGMPSRNRATSRSNRSAYWHHVAEKHGVIVEVLAYWQEEEDAFEHERFLIACFRSLGIPLVNLTDGGEGASGWRHSPEFRQWQSARVSKEAQVAEIQKKRSAAQLLRFAHPEARKVLGRQISAGWTPEKRAAAARRTQQHMASRKHHKLKLSPDVLAAIARKHSAGEMVKDIAHALGMHRTTVSRAIKLIAAAQGLLEAA